MVNSEAHRFDTTRICLELHDDALGSRCAAPNRLRWKIPRGLRIELDGFAERCDVAREQKLAKVLAIELLALDPIEARRLDHAEPGAERAAKDGPRLGNAVALQDP